MKFSFRRYRDLILGVVMLTVSFLYYYFAARIKTRPMLTPGYAGAQVVPRLLGVILAILSVLLIVQAVLRLKQNKGEDGEKMTRDDLLSVILTFAVTIFYVATMQPLGFILSTILFLFLLMNVLAPRDKRKRGMFLLISVVFTAIVFVAFRIGLSQLLPRGPIETLLGF